jgi:chemotaxis protein methyltransferase CheR
MRWQGFRRVRGQVCKRIARRLATLGLRDIDAYRAWLADDETEWRVVDRMCRVTISRLWRDRETLAVLGSVVLPDLAAIAVGSGLSTLDVWSCGCASGEEPHSIAMLFHERVAPGYPGLGVRILASDVDLHLLRRARCAVYPVAAARDVPPEVAAVALEPAGSDAAEVRVRDRDRAAVHIVQGDVRDGVPGGPFHMILCRNLVFTYFEERLQRTVGALLVDSLHAGGALVLGGHETLPDGRVGLQPWPAAATVFRRSS